MQALLAKLQEMLGAFADYGVPFVVTLSIVVFVHEFGHYWVARRCGVKVISFSIGMGPEIFGRTDKSGTRWKFSLLPIGGYVQMFGDADPASATVDAEAKAMPEDERKVAFFAQNVYKRMGPARIICLRSLCCLACLVFLACLIRPLFLIV
jgi:regulator of sigma E protease